MTTTDLVLAADTADRSTFGMLEAAANLAGIVAKTEFVPSSLRGKPDAIAACVLFGHELGIPPMASLSKIHVIDGRPAMAAELLRAVAMREGHEVWFEDQTATRVTACARRSDWPEDRVARVTWTMDDAKKAGLEGRQNWRKYPRAMLKARASAEICRDTFPDVLGGIAYAIEELDDGLEIDDAPAEAGAPATRTARKAPARQTRKAPAPAAKATPPAPAADTPPLPGEDGYEAGADTIEDDEAGRQRRRSQMVIIKAKEAGLTEDQRHELIGQVTNGRTTSSMDVTSAEATDVAAILDSIKAGADTIEEVLAIDAEIVETAEPDPTPEPVAAAPTGDAPTDVDGWRAELTARGIRMREVIGWAAEEAGHLNTDPPGNLAQLVESPEVAALVWMTVADRDEQ